MPEKNFCTAREINHICIAVNDIEDTLEFYQKTFGISSVEIEEIPDQGVRASMVNVGNSQLEFIEPIDPNGGVARYIESRGEGVHHICFEVENLPDTLKSLDASGIQLIDKVPRLGLSGMVAFIHPRATRGVLVELVDQDSVSRR